MRPDSAVRKLVSRISWWLLSAPIYVKVLGIGGAIAVIFTGVALLNIHGSMRETLYETLERSTCATADSLSRRLERSMVVDDLFTVRRELQRAMATFPEVRYIIVQDAGGRIIAHTFPTRVPADLLRVAPDQVPLEGTTQVLGTSDSEELLLEAAVPILEGGAGRLRLGVSDAMVTRERAAMTRSVVWTLALCFLVAGALGLALTHLMVRPVYRLVLAAERIRMGDFESKAEVYSGDEIGKLAVAFNRMGEALHHYREEVQEKEAARRALLERVVLAQEEERHRIARELHDQFGQSLLTLLLAIESAPRNDGMSRELRQDLEEHVRGLIDRVRRLAWNMRPSILDDYGLDSALARHVEELSRRFDDISVDYQCTDASDSARLPSRIEVALYRIAQEALANVLRHAQAHRASVVLLRQPGEVTLLVEDDGVGFDPLSVQETSDTSLGLTGMEERATLLGGSFVAESAPGSGTTVRVTIPLVGGNDECPSAY